MAQARIGAFQARKHLVELHGKMMQLGRKAFEIQSMAEENKDYLLAAAQDEEFDKVRSGAEAMIGEITKLLPTVEEVIATSQFSKDALKKADNGRA